MEIKSNGEIAWLEFPAGCFLLHLDVEEVPHRLGPYIKMTKGDAILLLFPEVDDRINGQDKVIEVWEQNPHDEVSNAKFHGLFGKGEWSGAIMAVEKITGYNMFSEVQPGMMVPHNCISTTPGV